MALIMNTGGQVAFFTQVFGASHPVTLKAKALAGVGVKFDVLFYGLKATGKTGQSAQLDLTLGPSALMKATGVSEIVMDQNKKLVEVWMGTLATTLGVQAEMLQPVQAIPVAAVKEWAAAVKPVDSVIDLKQAAALGQKVHGTSPGSVYYTIAIGQCVRVAARLNKGGAVSIRAEWTDGPSAPELKLLQDAGVQIKSNYGSIHFDAAGVPVQRVVGAFLMGTGIDWKAAVKSGSELVIGAI